MFSAFETTEEKCGPGDPLSMVYNQVSRSTFDDSTLHLEPEFRSPALILNQVYDIFGHRVMKKNMHDSVGGCYALTFWSVAG